MFERETLSLGKLKSLPGVLALLCSLVVPAIVIAQTNVITGSVRGQNGAPIVGAEVSTAPGGASAVTDEGGHFLVGGRGRGMLRARRLGFQPDSISIDSVIATPVTITLKSIATTLNPVVVRTNRVEYSGRLAGYYKRLDARSTGYFITRAEIDRENPRTLSQLIVRAPGMSAFRGRVGSSSVRMRGRRCWPLVWLDGSPMPSGDVDLDGIPPTTIQGVELYLGSTTAPIRYSQNSDLSSCGTILLWSRGPDTDPMRAKRSSGADLERLVASLSIYTAEQVDRPARPDSAKPLEVVYPPALFAERVSGSVEAEFVVGVDGRVEEETIGIISSTHRLFSEAVERAVEFAVFSPAIKGGRAVRQVVHQPFSFSVPGRAQ